MSDEAIKVWCVDQEYWYIRRFRCACGGEYERISQALLRGPTGDADLLETQCKKCGNKRDFLFDISEFMGAGLSAKKADILKECCQGTSISEAYKIANQLYLSPMSVAIMFLLKLAEAKDTLSIEYLSEAVEFAMQQAKAGD